MPPDTMKVKRRIEGKGEERAEDNEEAAEVEDVPEGLFLGFC